LGTRRECAAARKVVKVGYLGPSSPTLERVQVEAFKQRLHELGLVEGKDVIYLFRWAEGNDARFPMLASELVELKPDAIVTTGTPGTAVAAAAHFSQMAERLFGDAPYRQLADPLDRLLGYIDFRTAILAGPLPQFTCLLGTMVQEAYDTHPAIRRACDTYISAHAADVAKDIAAAKALYAPEAEWSAQSLALYTQAVLQGAFVLAKSKGGPEVARDCLAHLRRYLLQLFHRPPTKEE